MSVARPECPPHPHEPTADRIPRLLGRPPVHSLQEHEARYGVDQRRVRNLIEEIDEAGLVGRGGAGFPTASKMRAVETAARAGRRRRRPIVVANGAESEPASGKDRALLLTSPHLVIDGIAAAAASLGATRAFVCVDRRNQEIGDTVRAALSDRQGRDGLEISVAGAPSRYVAGEESALVSWLNGGLAKPAYKRTRAAERGVDAAPTLVDNVETLAHVALISRFGAAAWRAVGDGQEGGTMLVTVRGAVGRPGVYEIPVGRSLAQVLGQAGAAKSTGVLIGGYFGTWLTPAEADTAVMSARGLRDFGAAPGCGLIAVLPEGHCPLQEVSSVLRWMAANSAGQCGSCINGLPALAHAFNRLAGGDPDGTAGQCLDRWAPMLAGRGGCKLPDGTVRFLESSRRVFAADIEQHRSNGPCRPNERQLLPTPALGGWR